MTGRSGVEDNDAELHRFDVSGSTSIRPERREDDNQQAHFMISAKPIASSTPGMANARSCIIAPIPPP